MQARTTAIEKAIAAQAPFLRKLVADFVEDSSSKPAANPWQRTAVAAEAASLCERALSTALELRDIKLAQTEETLRHIKGKMEDGYRELEQATIQVYRRVCSHQCRCGVGFCGSLSAAAFHRSKPNLST
eukprot:SAG25_NODE_1263_length_3466_cov_2.420552_3_plen_129_part_00